MSFNKMNEKFKRIVEIVEETKNQIKPPSAGAFAVIDRQNAALKVEAFDKIQIILCAGEA